MLIRIDDFPTGVRPILKDMTPLLEILQEFENRKLPYLLGIVPALLSRLDIKVVDAVKNMKYLTPVVHGYNHSYNKCSRILIAENDPFNERGLMGSYDEFADQDEMTITTKLCKARSILEKLFKRPVTEFIPQSNMCSPACAAALVKAGYTLLYSNDPTSCKLPRVASDFYGRAYQLEVKPYKMITLHLTWEFDVVRLKGKETFLKGMDLLEQCYALGVPREQPFVHTALMNMEPKVSKLVE